MTPSLGILGTRGYPSFYGGFETAVRHLAPAFADEGWAVTVYGRRGEMDLDHPTRDARVVSRATSGVSSTSLSTLSHGFTSTLAAIKARHDAVIVMNVANGYFLPLLRMAHIRTAVNVDGIEWERAKWGGAAKAVFRLGARMTAKYADEIVVDSRAIGDRWQRDLGRSGVFIPYGGAPPAGPPACPPGYGSGKYVLMVARFVPENTVREFLEAARVIAKRWPVVVVGSSGYGTSELDSMADKLQSELGQVEWLGHVSDQSYLDALWTHAGAYFHGHSVGGTNPALVQAMACGAPVVARDTVYNREVLGNAGIFVDPTPAAIVDGLASVMERDTLRARMREEGVRRARDNYGWDGVSRRYVELLKGLVNS